MAILIRRGIIPPTTTNSVAYTNFIARALVAFPTLDNTHISAYQSLLNGLTTDGLFNSDGTTNFFDFLYIFATQDASVALLNLTSSSPSATANGSVTLTADQGYANATGSGNYVDLGFNAATASSPKFTQNDAHMAVWQYNNAATDTATIQTVGSAAGTNIFPKAGDNNTYVRINDNPESGGFAASDPRGLLIGLRTSSTDRSAYLNDVSIGSYGSTSSQAVLNANFTGVGASGVSIAGMTTSLVSAGASMSGAAKTAYYTRVRAYMTAVGVP